MYFILLLSFLFSSSAFAQAAISLAPTESFQKGLPGTSVEQEFVVINDGAVSYVLSCSFNDIWFEGENTVSGELGTQKERQAGYQLQCSPNRILVPPKYVQKIKVVGVIPKDQDGERFARFYTQMLPSDELSEGKGTAPRAMIGYSAKVGALIGLTADKTQKVSSEILDVKVEATKKFHVLHFKIKNTGNVHLRGTGTIILMDAADKAIEKVSVLIPFTYPSQTKAVSVTLTDPLKPGNYKALLSVAGATNEETLVKDFPVTFGK